MGHDNGVEPDGFVPFIFHGYLALRVGTQPVELFGLAEACRPVKERVRVHDRRRHELGGFGTGKPEHHSLISRALLSLEFLETRTGYALVDVGRLRVDHVHDGHRIAVKSKGGIRVSDFAGYIPNDALDINIGIGGDFSADEHECCRGECFAGDMAGRIVPEAGIENRVRNLVAELVRMAFADRFRSKKVSCSIHI